jgi:hypothetical protein
VHAFGAAYLCPDGLLCMAPPVGADDPRLWLALGHRLTALVAFVAVSVAAWRARRTHTVAAFVAVGSVLAQGAVGVAVERSLLEPGWVLAHGGLSLLGTAALAPLCWPRRVGGAEALVAGLLVTASAALLAVASTGAAEVCTAWPLCRPLEGAAPGVDGARIALLAAFLAVAVLAVRRGRASGAQLVLRVVGLLLGADLAHQVTGGGAEFALVRVALLHLVVVGAWWLLPVSQWLPAGRPATSPLPTNAPPSGAPTT